MILKTISSSDGGADFASPQAAWDALPATLIDSHIFEFITEGDSFRPTSGGQVLGVSGKAATAVNNVLFRKATGVTNIYFDAELVTWGYLMGTSGGPTQEWVVLDGVTMTSNRTTASISVVMGSADNCQVTNCALLGALIGVFLGWSINTANNTFSGNHIRATDIFGGFGGFTHTNIIFEKNLITGGRLSAVTGQVYAGFIMRKNVIRLRIIEWKGLTASSVIENNVIGTPSTSAQSILFTAGTTDVTVQHNLICANIMAFITGDAVGVKHFNNIFFNTEQERIYLFNATANETGFRSDGNIMTAPRQLTGINGAFFNIQTSASFTTLAAFQATTIDGVAPDANSFEIKIIPDNLATSLFESYYYRAVENIKAFPNIDKTSIAFEAGIDTTTTDDFYGATRNSTAPSIGPVETDKILATVNPQPFIDVELNTDFVVSL